MVKVTFVSHDGREQTVDVATGGSLMEGAKNNDIEGIEAVCGGNCYCATCRVHVTPDWLEKLGPASDSERALLVDTGIEDPSVRLSCQIKVDQRLESLIVRTPERQS